MGLGRSAAIVVGSFPLAESDRVVTFFSRRYGKLRGVARAARRVRSRFTGAFEMGTQGELVFFDTGRSDLVRVDHFDVTRPFARVRDDLDRLAQAAWMLECVTRLTAERDPNPAVYGLLARGLAAIEAGRPPGRVAVVFGLRLVDALGHRLRAEGCVDCGRRSAGAWAMDVEAGGLRCPACPPGAGAAVRLAPASLGALRRLRGQAWEEATAEPLGRAERDLRALLDCQVAYLAGQPARATRFAREIERFSGERR